MLPWLTQQAVAHLERGLLARAVVQQLVADAVALRASQAKGAAALADAQAAVAEACAAAVRAQQQQAGSVVLHMHACMHACAAAGVRLLCSPAPVGCVNCHLQTCRRRRRWRLRVRLSSRRSAARQPSS